MFRRLIREYLSLARGERRGLQVLLLLIIFMLTLRIFLPRLVQPGEPDLTLAEQEFMSFRDSLDKMELLAAGGEGYLTGREDFSAAGPDYPMVPGELFPFDPNTAGPGDLVRLGIPHKTARTLVNYRDAGGRFARDSDLLRVYGMQPELFGRLQPYIRIEQAGTFHSGPNENPGLPLFELNAADSLQLVSVYGIGPVFARRIVRYRELLGGFHRHEQLMEVYGFSPLQLEKLSRCSTIDTGLLRKLDLNLLDAGSLSEHPYIDPYQAAALVAFREQAGPYEQTAQVVENRLLPDSVFLKVAPYLQAGQ